MMGTVTRSQFFASGGAEGLNKFSSKPIEMIKSRQAKSKSLIQ